MARLLRALVLSMLVPAGIAAPGAPDPALEQRMLRIASGLRCLVCQNQTIADSQAALAVDLRQRVRELLARGHSDAQVLAFMTDRYGDFVLYRPPLKATTWLLWFGPGLLLLGGLAALAGVLRRRERLGDEHFEPDPTDTEDEGSSA